jgi:hypothetical protein
MSLDNMALRSFFFGSGEIAAIGAHLSPDLQHRASRFDVIMGWLWKCRTMALAPDSNEVMLLIIAVDARGHYSRAIPTGYYGNAFPLLIAVSTAGELCKNPVSYAIGLVKEAKDRVDMEYMRSAANLIVLRRGQRRRIAGAVYSLTDETKAWFHDFDFGWGKPVYVGPAQPSVAPALPWASSFVLPFKNANGEDGAVVPVFLPSSPGYGQVGRRDGQATAAPTGRRCGHAAATSSWVPRRHQEVRTLNCPLMHIAVRIVRAVVNI